MHSTGRVDVFYSSSSISSSLSSPGPSRTMWYQTSSTNVRSELTDKTQRTQLCTWKMKRNNTPHTHVPLGTLPFQNTKATNFLFYCKILSANFYFIVKFFQLNFIYMYGCPISTSFTSLTMMITIITLDNLWRGAFTWCC